MAYQLTPDDEKTLGFLMGHQQGPMSQFMNMADRRGSIEPANSVVDKFSMGGSMNPRTAALLQRLAQMRQPLNGNDVDAPISR